MAAAKGIFLSLALLFIQFIAAAPQAQDHGYSNIEEQQLGRRNVVSSTSPHASTSSRASSTTEPTFTHPSLTFVTIRAIPIRVTKQMQYVTSYSRIMTICPLAGQALPSQPVFSMSDLPTALVNSTNATLPSTGILPRNPDLAGKSVLPRQASNDFSTCSVFWEPIATPICHTTLSPLAAPLITVTECHQSVTFSSQFGYTLASGTSAPTVETMTTYYVVPWSDLSVGSVPTNGVVAQICSGGRSRDCSTRSEKWDTRLSEYTQVTRKTVMVDTTIVGPVTVIFDPAIDPITIEGSFANPVRFTTVVETTSIGTMMAITKAAASANGVAATSGVAMAESTASDLADKVATVSSTTTRTVTVALARSTETLPLPTASA